MKYLVVYTRFSLVLNLHKKQLDFFVAEPPEENSQKTLPIPAFRVLNFQVSGDV